MSVPTGRPNNTIKRIRIVLLAFLSIFLILLLVYVALPYMPLRRGPTPIVAVTPTEAATATLSATEAPTSTPSPTYTPVLPASPETEAPVTPSPTPQPKARTPTLASRVSSPTPTPTPLRAETPTVESGASPEVETLAETAQPVASPSLSSTPAAPASPPTMAASATPAPIAARVMPTGNVLRNSTFEQGFRSNGVAMGWDDFNNSSAEFSYQADTWPWVYAEAGRTQIMRIRNATLPDRGMGIYQTVNVVPGQVYTFSISGLVRTNTGDVQQTRFGYRTQIGFDPLGGHNWKAVENWIELPWDEQPRISERYRIDSYTTSVTARSSQLTVFVRAWKKWADAGEGAYDVDRISLVGPAYVAMATLPTPTTTAAHAPPTPAEIASADVPAAQAPPMPTTGGAEQSPWGNIRVLVTLSLLVVLIGGALWRVGRWRHM